MLAMQKPDVSQLTTLVGPVAEQMQAATALTEGRRSSAFNHQRTVAEALHALTWLVYTGPGCGEPLCRCFCIGCSQRLALWGPCRGRGLAIIVRVLVGLASTLTCLWRAACHPVSLSICGCLGPGCTGVACLLALAVALRLTGCCLPSKSAVAF